MTYEEAKNTIAEKYDAEKMECTCSPCKKCASIKLHKKSVEEAEKVVTVYDTVEKILLNSPEVKIECINKDANIREDLGIDNSDISWIMIAIEVELDVKITVSEFVNKITTVEDIVNSVVEKMKKQKRRQNG